MGYNIMNPGQRIKQIRKELKIKQEELGGERFSKNYISMFENNKRQINPINATFLAERINYLAKKKNKNLEITVSYLLKTEEDIAKDKCHEWLEHVENSQKLSNQEIITDIYNAIVVSTKFDLWDYYARALFLLGINSMNRGLYNCAVTQFLEASYYFSKMGYQRSILETCKLIGITLYRQKEYNQSIIYLNLADNILRRILKDDEESIEEIRYYKALCYYELNQYKEAQIVVHNIHIKNKRLLELTRKIDQKLVV